MYLLRVVAAFLVLVALALPLLKFLGWIAWSWWLVMAPLWALALLVLIAGTSLTVLIERLRRPPK